MSATRGLPGLTVRWSLVGTADDVVDELATYVEGSSHARFTGMAGLRFKTWRAVRGAWFEGNYVFADDEERDRFQAGFTANAASSPVTQIVGTPPELIEPCEIIAVAEGWEGFEATPRF